MARTLNPSLHALWRARITRQLTSGLSVEEFCAQGQFARSAFYRWRHRLKFTSPAAQSSAPLALSTFLPVTVRLVESYAQEAAPIEAELPNGIRLRIPTANVQLACRLVRTVARTRTGSGGSR
jgi:hypothetical protein